MPLCEGTDFGKGNNFGSFFCQNRSSQTNFDVTALLSSCSRGNCIAICMYSSYIAISNIAILNNCLRVVSLRENYISFHMRAKCLYTNDPAMSTCGLAWSAHAFHCECKHSPLHECEVAFRQYRTFVDDYTKCCKVYFINNKFLRDTS